MSDKSCYSEISSSTDALDRIKYIYSIDVDALTSEFKKTESYINYRDNPEDKQCRDALLHGLFDEIFDVCDLYTEYLSENFINISQFGDYKPGCENTLIAYRSFLQLALRNHCILNDFNNRIQSPEPGYGKISNKNDYKNKLGYFNGVDGDSDAYQTQSPQVYKDLRNRQAANKDSYSMSFIRAMGSAESNDDLEVYSKPYMAACDYIYNSNEAHSLDRNLAKDDVSIGTMWKNYTALEVDYRRRAEGYVTSRPNNEAQFSGFKYSESFKQSGSDLFLFTAPLEMGYGFTSFRYIAKKMNQISEEKRDGHSDNNIFSLRDFDGSIINTFFSSMLKSRLIYSRELFLEYALFSLINSRNLDPTYLTGRRTAETYRFAAYETSSKEVQLSKALNLFRQFSDTLNKVTIPLLEDLWSVCITQLVVPMLPEGSDIISFYKGYVDDHILLLTTDYTQFSEDTLASFIRRDRFASPRSLDADLNYEILEPALEALAKKKTDDIHYKIKNIEKGFSIINGIEASDPSEKKDMYIAAYENRSSSPYMDIPGGYREMIKDLLGGYLSISAPRYSKSSCLHGYVNHMFSGMQKSGPMNSYEIAFNDYSREILLKSIDLYGKTDN